MAVQIVMDHTGDTRHHFDSSDSAATTLAATRFQELLNSRLLGRSAGSGWPARQDFAAVRA